ncbi:butyrophilin subfamily 1 member A1 [Microcaecilia unicolor]|uniref:Butyrophilin subfamily 1 member A1-like n=1 Tax=Microcaecilia unicolor TaxID=1415580 RepID=A0A6P7XWT1_9AMPH|nr:butyrophilin subfamily 1 member A1-like [Microcaecilia unicolor]
MATYFAFIFLLSVLGVGGSQEVKARLYTKVVLPCEFPFVQGPENLFISWEKEDKGRDIAVHSFHDNIDHPEEQAAQYRGRTSLTKELSRGVISLELTEVTSSDAGIYMCKAANLNNRGSKLILLTIDELEADDPKVTVEQRNGMKVLKCVSSGRYKNPQVEWHDRKMNDLTSHAETNVSEAQSDGTRTVESVLNLPITTNEHYFCHIHEEHLKRSVRAVPSDGQLVELNDEL